MRIIDLYISHTQQTHTLLRLQTISSKGFSGSWRGRDWNRKYFSNAALGKRQLYRTFTNEHNFKHLVLGNASSFFTLTRLLFCRVSEESNCYLQLLFASKTASLKEIHVRLVCCSTERTDPPEEGQHCYTLQPGWKWRPLNSRLIILLLTGFEMLMYTGKNNN